MFERIACGWHRLRRRIGLGSGKSSRIARSSGEGIEHEQFLKEGHTPMHFGMRVLYCNRSQKVDVETAASAERSTLADLLKRSDIVSLHLPIIPETTGMIGAAELATMKPDAFLINAARPMLVEPHALATALRAKTIAGCAMDGYYIEPVPDRSKDPFWLLALDDEVFIVSPHVAYLTQRSILKMCQMATDSVIRILNNEPWEHIVNSECRPNR